MLSKAERQIHWIVCQIYFIRLLLWRKQILDQELWAAFPSKSNQKQQQAVVWVRLLYMVNSSPTVPLGLEREHRDVRGGVCCCLYFYVWHVWYFELICQAYPKKRSACFCIRLCLESLESLVVLDPQLMPSFSLYPFTKSASVWCLVF